MGRRGRESSEVTGQSLSIQMRRPGLSLAPESARGAEARSEVRRPGAGKEEETHSTPENGTLDGAKPDSLGLVPHPYPTWELLLEIVALPPCRPACCLEM